MARPRIVKRGTDGFAIEEGEPQTVDHVLFLVHGIGSVCDLKFRPLEEVGNYFACASNSFYTHEQISVDDFRTLSFQLVQSHYKKSCEQDLVHRVEVLPISWHKKLHSEGTGIDGKLKQITLDSIPRLRDFTNDTLLDILFYSSPVYCQVSVRAVCQQLSASLLTKPLLSDHHRHSRHRTQSHIRPIQTAQSHIRRSRLRGRPQSRLLDPLRSLVSPER